MCEHCDRREKAEAIAEAAKALCVELGWHFGCDGGGDPIGTLRFNIINLSHALTDNAKAEAALAEERRLHTVTRQTISEYVKAFEKAEADCARLRREADHANCIADAACKRTRELEGLLRGNASAYLANHIVRGIPPDYAKHVEAFAEEILAELRRRAGLDKVDKRGAWAKCSVCGGSFLVGDGIVPVQDGRLMWDEARCSKCAGLDKSVRAGTDPICATCIVHCAPEPERKACRESGYARWQGRGLDKPAEAPEATAAPPPLGKTIMVCSACHAVLPYIPEVRRHGSVLGAHCDGEFITYDRDDARPPLAAPAPADFPPAPPPARMLVCLTCRRAITANDEQGKRTHNCKQPRWVEYVANEQPPPSASIRVDGIPAPPPYRPEAPRPSCYDFCPGCLAHYTGGVTGSMCPNCNGPLVSGTIAEDKQ